MNGLASQDQGRTAPAFWVADLRRCADALAAVDETEGLLPDADRERLAVITNAEAQAERRTAHLALRVLIEGMIGRHARAAEFIRSPLGRPSLPGSPIDFSLSHAGRLALIGLWEGGAIGVDIEHPRTVGFPEDRKRRLVMGAVSLAGRALPYTDEQTRLIAAWSRLESFAKADGCGMARVLGRVGVVGPHADRVADSFGDWPGEMTSRTRILDVAAPDGYVAAACLITREPVTDSLSSDISGIAPLILPHHFPTDIDSIFSLLAA